MIRVALLVLLLSTVSAWVSPKVQRKQEFGKTGLRAKSKKKGFGKSTAPPKRKKKTEPVDIYLGEPPLTDSSDITTSDSPDLDLSGGPKTWSTEMPEVSPGARFALDKMKAKADQDKQQVDARIAELDEVQETLKENPTAGVIPDKVAKRMLFRMLPLAATPIIGGIALFVYFYLSATKGDTEFQPTVVAYATTAPWLLGLAGLTYGLISSSWDEDVEGSFLGFDEFKINVERITDGVKRGAQNQELRELRDQRDNNRGE